MTASTATQRSPAPRLHTDEELTAALHPFVCDHLARLAEDRERHGGDGARMLACGRLSHYYTLMHTACEDAASGREGGGP